PPSPSTYHAPGSTSSRHDAMEVAVIQLLSLVLAAALEICGVAAVRRGLLNATWLWAVAGVAMLAGYGMVVNLNRQIDFGRLMGIYIAVFFVASQALAMAMFGERPSSAQLLGGGLVVAGGLVIQVGTRS